MNCSDVDQEISYPIKALSLSRNVSENELFKYDSHIADGTTRNKLAWSFYNTKRRIRADYTKKLTYIRLTKSLLGNLIYARAKF